MVSFILDEVEHNTSYSVRTTDYPKGGVVWLMCPIFFPRRSGLRKNFATARHAVVRRCQQNSSTVELCLAHLRRRRRPPVLYTLTEHVMLKQPTVVGFSWHHLTTRWWTWPRSVSSRSATVVFWSHSWFCYRYSVMGDWTWQRRWDRSTLAEICLF